MSIHVLVVEDDLEIARIIRDHLQRKGYAVTWASTGQEGWDDFQANHYDLVIIDLMLPEMDGFTLVKHIRLETDDVPLLIISARHEDDDKVRGFRGGADDYLTKPFSLLELEARIESHLRRFRRYHREQFENNERLTFQSGLSIDFYNKIVTLNGAEVALTSKEYALLVLLIANPGRVFSKKELYEHIWNHPDVEGNNTITVHIKSIRTKLNDPIKQPIFIQTVWGMGYRFIGEVCV
ncbi:response regulator transcription factor [Calidifontibacillus oryziterrae]|uniref:response regulator transcription factor n=1 Tax=Calidifontibacillus oryziterrae TaxID=1191699 RepID=UPI0002F69086|nr:response regulator transcription factor [Calidifontibacillus oryziterrae]